MHALLLAALLPGRVFAADPQPKSDAPVKYTEPAASPRIPGVSDRLQGLYDDAFKYYTAGDFQKAVAKWNQVIQEDPDQNSAREWLVKARRAIWEKTKEKQAELASQIAAGRYEKSQATLQTLFDLDPDDPKLKAVRQRLDGIVAIVKVFDKPGQAARAARAGVAAYLAFDPDFQLAYDAVRYASEKEPADELFKRLSEAVLEEEPSIIKDEIPPGMTLISYKQHEALSDIYDGRYTRAIKVLKEIVVFEPDSVTAWERLGSSYYCLGLKSEADHAWRRAKELAPEDRKLESFLSGKRKLKCGARR